MHIDHMPINRRRCAVAARRLRRAYSLLEVVLASSICATAIVPALAVLRDGIALGEIIDTRHLLLTYGVSKMEEQLAIVGATWTTGTVTGNFASDGQSSIRFSVTRSDAAVSGGIIESIDESSPSPRTATTTATARWIRAKRAQR